MNPIKSKKSIRYLKYAFGEKNFNPFSFAGLTFNMANSTDSSMSTNLDFADYPSNSLPIHWLQTTNSLYDCIIIQIISKTDNMIKFDRFWFIFVQVIQADAILNFWLRNSISGLPIYGGATFSGNILQERSWTILVSILFASWLPSFTMQFRIENLSHW